jgi:hypothetical protein
VEREREKIKRERIKSETERLLGCAVRHSIRIECLSQVFPNACCFNESFGRTRRPEKSSREIKHLAQ